MSKPGGVCNRLVQSQAGGVQVTSKLIRAKVQLFANLYGIDPNSFLSLSNCWLDSFKAHHSLKQYHCHGEAGSVQPVDVAEARKRIRMIKSKFPLSDVYNMDETGLYYRMPPDRGLASQQTSGVKGDKTRLTLAFCVNADGTDRRAPLILGHAR